MSGVSATGGTRKAMMWWANRLRGYPGVNPALHHVIEVLRDRPDLTEKDAIAIVRALGARHDELTGYRRKRLRA